MATPKLAMKSLGGLRGSSYARGLRADEAKAADERKRRSGFAAARKYLDMLSLRARLGLMPHDELRRRISRSGLSERLPDCGAVVYRCVRAAEDSHASFSSGLSIKDCQLEDVIADANRRLSKAFGLPE